MTLGDEWLKDILSSRLERSQGTRLVRAHEAAVADHIRDQDRGKPTLHLGPPPMQIRIGAKNAIVPPPQANEKNRA
jgi:hypothetical protein